VNDLKRLWVAVLAGVLMACGGSDDMTGTDGGTGTLVVEDIVVGTGATAAAGNTVTVHYTGTFTNGQQFDSSRGRTPFTFRLGAGSVIAGFDQGITGMKVGGTRRLTIPPNLAYGNTPPPGFPAGATLRFDIELLAVQ
jgi:FKBP-type peptidyl-prolyl cis-trans isomerase FkpA